MRLTNEQFDKLRNGTTTERGEVISYLMDGLVQRLKMSDDIKTVRFVQGQIDMLETFQRVLVFD